LYKKNTQTTFTKYRIDVRLLIWRISSTLTEARRWVSGQRSRASAAADARLPPTNKSKAGGGRPWRRSHRDRWSWPPGTDCRPRHPACFTDTRLTVWGITTSPAEMGQYLAESPSRPTAHLYSPKSLSHHMNMELASCLIYARALLEYVILLCGWVLLTRCYHPWNSRKIRCSLSLFSMKNA